MSERELYIKKFEAKLDEWKAEAQALRARAEGAGADAQLEAMRELESVERQIDDAEERLGELRKASDDAWESIKAGAEDAWSSLSEGFSKAADRLKG
jgi:chromosome segregation ATPase